MFEVQELEAITVFDKKLWLTIIDTVTVHSDGRLTFKFQGGTEIDALVCRRTVHLSAAQGIV